MGAHRTDGAADGIDIETQYEFDIRQLPECMNVKSPVDVENLFSFDEDAMARAAQAALDCPKNPGGSGKLFAAALQGAGGPGASIPNAVSGRRSLGAASLTSVGSSRENTQHGQSPPKPDSPTGAGTKPDSPTGAGTPPKAESSLPKPGAYIFAAALQSAKPAGRRSRGAISAASGTSGQSESPPRESDQKVESPSSEAEGTRDRSVQKTNSATRRVVWENPADAADGTDENNVHGVVTVASSRASEARYLGYAVDHKASPSGTSAASHRKVGATTAPEEVPADAGPPALAELLSPRGGGGRVAARCSEDAALKAARTPRVQAGFPAPPAAHFLTAIRAAHGHGGPLQATPRVGA
eukprot:TRINITY_DN10209_c0_g1_i1.p1 TRINITY_DN10209_c0_g1~~TRINITY_DN10209_c0_g1_i1.p1  ORF type:complete len:355 (+),score=62.43 TRINITY_DN10209_c0_g1_i1:112-1176(+)